MAVATQRYEAAEKCGIRLKRVRKELKLTLKHVGELAGFTAQQIFCVEKGEINTPIETLARIAEALNIPLERILCGDEAPTDTQKFMEDIMRWASVRPQHISQALRDLADELDALKVHD